MSPIAKPRRTTRLTYEGHGILVGRIENERRLWHGMKDHHAFVVPERGAWEFLYRGATYQQSPGTIQLKQPAEIYRDLRREGPASYDIVVFDPAALTGAREASSAAPALVFETPQLLAGDPRAAALLALRALARPDQPDPALAIETAIAEAALALVSLGAAQRAAGREHRAVVRTKAYLRERLAERIRLDEVADHVRLDKYHLVRSFRAQVGVPPYEYLTHLRIHRARELLRTGIAAGTVATTVGFYDQSQLHRHFVRLVGMTPGRYAASARSSRAAIALAYDYGLDLRAASWPSGRATPRTRRHRRR